MTEICFYCPEDIFQPGGGATVAVNVLKNFNKKRKKTIILSKNTVVPKFIKDSYNVKQIWYPSYSLLRFCMIYL